MKNDTKDTKERATIEYFEKRGWRQSSEIEGALVFEKDDDGNLDLMVTNQVGVVFSEVSFDQYAIEAGCPASFVATIQKQIQA